MIILSRLGGAVSSDTYDRFVIAIAEEHKHSPHGRFCLQRFSAYIFDKQSRHALVYSEAKSRGYHGTTIMAVQPIPSAKLD